MADRDDSDRNGNEPSITPPTESAAVTPAGAATGRQAPRHLPDIESPSISPAVSEAVAIEEEAIEPKSEPEVEAANRAPLRALVPLPRPAAETPGDEPPLASDATATPKPRFVVKPRHWRTMRLAASVAIGAALGAVFGAYATGGLVGKPPVNVAAQEENKAMEQSVAKLAKEVTTLKAHLDAANKRAQTQTASLEKKLSEQINERLKREAADITGSISAPQTVAAASAQPSVADVPTPRPAPRIAMAASTAAAPSQPARPPVVRDWSVRGAHQGYVYVQGRDGDIYQVVPGAPLPGLGPVESIRLLDGRWVVKTPKGIIVSSRDRHYFE